MPEKTVSENGRVTSETTAEVVRSWDDSALRELAVEHLENVRRFKRYLSIYLLGMLVLTPIWVITQYEQADGWLQHLSSRSRYAGDWDPWLIWVGLVGAFSSRLPATGRTSTGPRPKPTSSARSSA